MLQGYQNKPISDQAITGSILNNSRSHDKTDLFFLVQNTWNVVLKARLPAISHQLRHSSWNDCLSDLSNSNPDLLIGINQKITELFSERK